jgi:hypothetical protein
MLLCDPSKQPKTNPNSKSRLRQLFGKTMVLAATAAANPQQHDAT